MVQMYVSMCTASSSVKRTGLHIRNHASTRRLNSTSTSNLHGPNSMLIRKLTQEAEMALQHDKDGAYKSRAIRRAISAMSMQEKAIKSGRDALKIVGIGEGIARRIDFILQEFDSDSHFTRTPDHKIVPENASERDRILAQLKRVPGIGTVKATRLYEEGCRSLKDLHKPEYLATLSNPIRVALKYVDHLDRRISREQIGTIVERIQGIVEDGPKIHIVGSHRRESPLSSEIELIVFHPSCVYVPNPDDKSPGDLRSPSSGIKKRPGRPAKQMSASRIRLGSLLREFILDPLERTNVIAATLSECPRRWQGVVRLSAEPSAYRKMTITLFPQLSEGAALIATTGDNDFVSYLKRLASSQGLHLNEFGLWRWISNNVFPTKGQVQGGHWELIASKMEEEVFSALGLNYVEPQRRNFAFIINEGKEGTLLKQPRTPTSRPSQIQES